MMLVLMGMTVVVLMVMTVVMLIVITVLLGGDDVSADGDDSCAGWS